MEFIKFSRDRLDEARNFINHYTDRILITLDPRDATIEFQQIGAKKMLKAHEGNYIVKTDDTIPNMLPTTNYFEVRKERPLGVK